MFGPNGAQSGCGRGSRTCHAPVVGSESEVASVVIGRLLPDCCSVAGAA